MHLIWVLAMSNGEIPLAIHVNSDAPFYVWLAGDIIATLLRANWMLLLLNNAASSFFSGWAIYLESAHCLS